MFIRISHDRIIRKDQIREIKKTQEDGHPAIYYFLMDDHDVRIMYKDRELRDKKFEEIAEILTDFF